METHKKLCGTSGGHIIWNLVPSWPMTGSTILGKVLVTFASSPLIQNEEVKAGDIRFLFRYSVC